MNWRKQNRVEVSCAARSRPYPHNRANVVNSIGLLNHGSLAALIEQDVKVCHLTASPNKCVIVAVSKQRISDHDAVTVDSSGERIRSTQGAQVAHNSLRKNKRVVECVGTGVRVSGDLT